ncbi:hypothetical protein [Actinoplanes sp. NBRC 103695]|uniref:hypothetical protein n=1 Tax=Actinoplanes sp. NBRC 103695 TaxID=3032202 RepID=UPI0024A2A94E|nr:hypothetical protein [Actinoplanes sp. NBRC 103695]GLY94438.1 hypothetical protein Acsp02_16940 [Actinoplanes sp. NBRC 103695]
MTVGDLKREVLVRHLETWAPAALHKRRATYVHGGADADGGALAEAALRVFAEQSDLVRGRELTMVAVGEDAAGVGPRLEAVGVDSPGFTLHVVAGRVDARLAAVLKAVGAARVPLLGFIDATSASGPPSPESMAALAAGKPAEALLVLAAGAVADVDAYRAELRDLGFPLVAAVELATGEEPGELLVYATALGKSLESFKETLWAVDEFAGVRYRDPGDPERHLIDISLTPHPGPLRRELLAHLESVGEATVAELRTFALTETVYRAADASQVLQKLVASGAVTRSPDGGRLGGDVTIRPA